MSSTVGEPRTRRGTWIAAGTAVALAVAAGAGFAAGTAVSGGGVQPEDVLPDTVMAYVDLDLDPSAEQKINLVRLLGEFPDVERDYGADPDLRQLAVDWLTEGTALEGRDAQEWVGDRLGLGLSWDSGAQALTPVAAVQVTDEQRAVADLSTVLEADQVAVTEGYVVVAGDPLRDLDGEAAFDIPSVGRPQTAEEVVAAGATSPLAQSPQFTEVFDRLDEGVLTLYLDGAGLSSAVDDVLDQLGLAAGATAEDLEGLSDLGQSGAVLRAEPNALELLGWSNAVSLAGTAPATLVQSLPASTLIAAEATGAGDRVREQWARSLAGAADGTPNGEVEDLATELEARLDLRLPEDLETLLGEDLVVAVDGEGLLTGVPGVGLRSVTDPEAAADLAGRLQAALSSLTGGFGLTAAGTADGLVVASSEEFAERLVTGDGALGSDPGFQSAVPDAGRATALVWVDVGAISGFAQLAAPESSDLLSPLQSFGVAITPEGAGSQVRVRLVFEEVDE